mmetsp:Transcript_16747/g.48178  ORF Transcript_16747/g.48178 Transcript_16747/m.48178 type:complete len:441 (-) Transcript_16747:1031-2353(-)
MVKVKVQRRPRQRLAKQIEGIQTLSTKIFSFAGFSAKRRGRGKFILIGLTAIIPLIPLWLVWSFSSTDRLAPYATGDLLPVLKSRISRSVTSPHGSAANSRDNNRVFEANVKRMGGDELKPKVFIGIKTGEGLTGHRFTQVRRTWLQDAFDETIRGQVDIKFFTQDADIVREDLPTDLSDKKSLLGDRNGLSDVAFLRSLFVSTNCTLKKDLLCGTSAMFKYYLEKHGNGTYFCSFDDDQYVLVRNLLRVLDEYKTKDPRRGQNIYVGKMPGIGKGVPLKPIPKPVSWLTGGAGYCLSRDLVERGRHFLTNLGTVWHGTGRKGYTDDCAVGYVVTQKMDTKLIEDERFHSHLEFRIQQKVPLTEVSRQVSFGFNTKLRDHKDLSQHPRAKQTIPNIPMRFSSEEDPMLFRSLRCFLIKEDTGRDAPECGTAVNESLFAPS